MRWCPLANLFPSAGRARTWADEHGVEDYTLFDLTEAVEQAAPLWKAVLAETSSA